MEHPALRGRSILVVENEPLIAMDIVQALESAGANATMTTAVRHALILVEHDGLSGAIMDHALSDGDSTKLCARLSERGIPYLSYSGYEPVEGASKDAPHIMKPVSMDTLMSAMAELLQAAARFRVRPAARLFKLADSRQKLGQPVARGDLRGGRVEEDGA